MTSITEETGAAQATATGKEPKATKKARVGQKRAHVAPKKGKPAPASRMRAEDDPRKRGNHWAFAKASIAFAAPKDLSVLGDGAVEIRLVVKGYKVGALQPGGPVPHVHLIVDNDPALEIDDARVAWALGGLAPGPHLLRAVLCRPWHEVVKARKAFAMTRFWVGPRLAGKAGTAPFAYRDKGSMATIGHLSAVTDAFGMKFTGVTGYTMWGFVHVLYLIGWGNRVAAVFSWARALTFSKNRPHRTITYEHAQNELAEHHHQPE